jgi:hypothetical protein
MVDLLVRNSSNSSILPRNFSLDEELWLMYDVFVSQSNITHESEEFGMSGRKKFGVLSEIIKTEEGDKEVFFIGEWDRNYGWGCRSYIEHYNGLTYRQADAICTLLKSKQEKKVAGILNSLVNE